MSVKTICKILHALDSIRGTDASLRAEAAEARMLKWLKKMRPDRPHQWFSWMLGRYVDEGE